MIILKFTRSKKSLIQSLVQEILILKDPDKKIIEGDQAKMIMA